MTKIQNPKFKIQNSSDGFTPTPERELLNAGAGSADSRLVLGFTLIEVTVTIMVFSIMVVLIGSIFARAVELERRTVWSQRVQENATLVLESMAKEIRVSDIVNQDSSDCTATTLNITHPVNGAISYTMSGNNILRQGAFASIINSSEVQFTRLNFCVTGSGASDNMSPKVTILMSLQSVRGTPPSSVNLQTTVTSRAIRSEFENP